VSVKFSLAGDQGLDIFADGYQKSQEISSNNPDVEVPGNEPTETSGTSSFTCDPRSDEYQYRWKTKRAWEGTCQQLVVKLKDVSFHRANFRFT